LGAAPQRIVHGVSHRIQRFNPLASITGMYEDLSKSYYLKTCTNCSQREGYPVFKPYPEAFGKSEKRARDGAQPWCYECRRRALPSRDDPNAPGNRSRSRRYGPGKNNKSRRNVPVSNGHVKDG